MFSFVQVTPIKKVTIQRTQQDRSLLSVHIKDATGVIPMTLWGKIAEQHTSLKVGDCVSVHQAERGTFSNKPTLNTWEDTTKVEVYIILLILLPLAQDKKSIITHLVTKTSH